jgi:hypothetical protein
MSTEPDYLTGDWQVLYDHPDMLVETMDLGSHLAVRRTFKHTAQLVDQNRAACTESNGKTFGDGKVVASIPLNFYFEHFGQAAKEGDRKYIEKKLNDSDFRDFRTFRGKL